MAVDRLRLNEAERANLVAYLDGELNAAEARAISVKYDNSPTVRREIDSLKQTWNFLESLPKPQAGDAFATRTASLVTQMAQNEEQFYAGAWTTLKAAARESAWIALIALSGVAAYASARWIWPDSSARLDEDLTILENLESYRVVGSFEFLQELEDSPHFDQVAP